MKFTYVIEWNGDHWYCYSKEYGKFSCYGLGDTPLEALQSYEIEKKEFKDFLMKQSGPEGNSS